MGTALPRHLAHHQRNRVREKTVGKTEMNIGEELVEMGVTRTDIVLGFQPAYMRPFTQFAAE